MPSPDNFFSISLEGWSYWESAVCSPIENEHADYAIKLAKQLDFFSAYLMGDSVTGKNIGFTLIFQLFQTPFCVCQRLCKNVRNFYFLNTNPIKILFH